MVGFRDKKLKIHHYVSIIALLALVPTLVFSITLSIDFLEKGENLRKQHLYSASYILKEVDSFLETHLLAIDTLAKQTSEMDLPLTELEEAIRQVNNHYGGFTEIYYDGFDFQYSTYVSYVSEHYRTFKAEQVFNCVSRSYFTTIKKPYISSFTRDLNGNGVIFIAVPVHDRGDDYAGFIMGTLDLTYLQKLIDKHKTYDSGYTFLLDAQGQVINNPGESQPQIEELAFTIIKELNEEGSGSLEYMSPVFNRWEIAGFMTLPDYGWGVWVAAPRYEVMLPLYRVAGLFLFLIILGIVVILLMRRLLVKNISQPLTELNLACMEFSSGNLAYRVRLKQRSLPLEIITLGEKFNFMAASMQHTNTLLKIHTDDLEERVRSRTQELLIKNRELSALYAVASSVSSTEDLEKVLENVLHEITDLFQVEASTIWVNKEKDEKYILTVWKPEVQDDEKSVYNEYLEGVSWQSILEGHPVLNSEMKSYLEGAASSELQEIKLKSLISVPILHKETTLGTITLASYVPNRFRKEDLNLLQAICNQLGIVISNVSLFNVINKGHNTLQAVMNSMHEGLVLFNDKAVLIYANPAFLTRFGVNHFYWEGMNFHQLQMLLESQNVKMPWNDLWDDFIQQRDFQFREASIALKEKLYYYMILGFPVLSNGQFIGYGFVFRDITREKEVDTLKNSILSTVSHELRTPLTTIRGSAESLLRQDVNWGETDKREFLTAIVDESKRLRELIDNIMDMSKIEAGALKLDLHHYDINKVINKVVSRFQKRFPEALFLVECDSRTTFVEIDDRRIEQVLGNLLENGIKYSKTKPEITIKTQYCSEENMVRVSVVDNGIGIDPQYREAVFERFYRVDTAISKKVGGSGVGLSIAKGIVEAHGGKIWIDEQNVRGCQITFTIPCAQ